MTSPQVEEGGALHKALRRVVEVRPEEVRAMLTSFAFFFFILCAYFILRPIRDSVAAASGVRQLPRLYLGTLIGTLIFNPALSMLVSRLPVRRFMPITYQFFAVNILIFYCVLRFWSHAEGSAVDIWTGRAFFVWLTVYALFNTSVFWAFMADMYKSEQAKRLFGFIGVGGTLGSITGSAVTAALSQRIGAVNVLLVSFALLQLGILMIRLFPASNREPGDAAATRRPRDDSKPIGGSVWAGFTNIVKSPYLIGISVFLLLFTFGSTFIYAQQADLVGALYADRSARSAVLARIELAVQVLTVLTQIFFTGRIIRWLGLAMALALLPLISIVGFTALGIAPVFHTLVVFTVIRRAGNFALNNPAMEVLFTVIPREDKYKAKNFIETFVYRAGDQIGAGVYAGLTAIGLGMAGISFIAVPVSAIWLVIGVWLGRKHATLAGERSVPGSVSRPLAVVP